MLHSKKSVNSFLHSTTNNDSKISVDSDIQEMKSPFTLRVINPDLYEQDNEPPVKPYKSTLVPNSVSSTPELRHATIQQQPQSTSVIIVPSTTTPINAPNSWHSNNEYGFPTTTTTTTTTPSLSPQQQQPTVGRKASKVLVEHKTVKNNEIELLPPLQIAAPLLTMNESHLLSSSSTNTPSISGDLAPITLNQVSPLEALSIKSSTSSSQPPVLPQHHPDYFSSKGSPSVAQQSINALIIPTAELTLSPDDDLNDTPTSPIIQTQVYNAKTSRELLNESLFSLERLSTQQSITPSMAQQQQKPPLLSKYSKASYSLTNNPDAIKLYRTMALKTGDPMVQLTYAKYLLEVASLYDSKENRQPFKPNLSLSLPLLKRKSGLGRPSSIASSRRSSVDTQMSNFRRDSSGTMMQQQSLTDDEESSKKKKKKMLEEEGVRWIKKLAKQRVGEAAYLLGLWYDRGMYGFRKSTKALKFYEIAANAKVPEAMFAVGQYHEREQDYMTSFQLYEDAASLGLVEALYRIAMINLNGEFGSRRNITVAIQLLMKASEKSTGTCPEAPYTLGLLLTNDYPTVNIPSELIQTYGGTFAATTYLEYAADMGMSIAQYRLGCIYEKGLFGIRVNLAKAFDYYELAANSNSNSYAMLALSRLYNQGVKVPQEQLQGQLSSFEQDESGWMKSHPRDEDAAFRWCHLAAAQNIPDACYLLGWYFEFGIGIPRDFQQAHHYYNKASKKGNHKIALERVMMLENLVKHQKNEKRRTITQDKRRMSNANQLKSNNSSSKESQCTIM